ncbi:DUF3772 domain-containing protein [Rhodobaculum claviforme]|uniref:DUF3772 domain-containing protein n=1 Tax=Rhodobaculum claviforme TaxID=1549854 RepID=UPI0019139F1E
MIRAARTRRPLRAVLRAATLLGLVAVLWLSALQPAAAQTSRTWLPGAAQTGTVDQAEWERLVSRVELVLADPRATNLTLEQLRAQTAEWRSRFLAAQNANTARIQTLRGQLGALGPPPAEGQVETPEIAQRRADLTAQLAREQAPGVAAEEAFRHADGLIREIDQILRDRQADALMQLSPSPVNPTNWPVAVRELTGITRALGRELTSAWGSPLRRAQLHDNLPLIGLYLLVAMLLMVRGRQLAESLTLRMQMRASARGQMLLATLVSLAQVAVPFLGVLALVEALRASGMVGLRSQALVEALPQAGFTLLAARWLGGQVFPKRGDDGDGLLTLPPERRREGRWHVTALGFVLAGLTLGTGLLAPVVSPPAALSVLGYPFLALCGLLLLRIGQLMRRHVVLVSEEDSPRAFADRLIGLVGQAAMLLGVAGPVLGAVGYLTAGAALVYPAINSLALIALLMLAQRLVAELYALLRGGDAAWRDTLVPTLIGFAMVIASLPVFALVWGARESQLRELWTGLRDGFALGETRVSPADFLAFLVVFGVGFAVTRVVQGALRTSVLPKTSIEKGAQAAVVSGVGYLGVFVAVLLAVTATGLDLSNLAIVAGALSVGIGFGLQTVVSNFVSGIILLFERPIAEGDWIEVGGVMGTVRKISVRATVIQTFDRTDVIVPNADLISGHVTNWTRYNKTGRLIVPVSVAYGSDTRKVEQILYDVAEAQPLVSLNPAPSVLFRSFGADGLEFEVRVILRDVNFLLKVHSDMNHEIARRFVEENIEIPFGQTDVWLRNADDVARVLRALPAAAQAQTPAAAQAQTAAAQAPGPAAPPKETPR